MHDHYNTELYSCCHRWYWAGKRDGGGGGDGMKMMDHMEQLTGESVSMKISSSMSETKQIHSDINATMKQKIFWGRSNKIWRWVRTRITACQGEGRCWEFYGHIWLHLTEHWRCWRRSTTVKEAPSTVLIFRFLGQMESPLSVPF